MNVRGNRGDCANLTQASQPSATDGGFAAFSRQYCVKATRVANFHHSQEPIQREFHVLRLGRLSLQRGTVINITSLY